ncbi:MAG: glycosyltransferase family 2 protein [Deltaproteobacteria bacterium]|nr:glycosyltransferase family 2 protein [Deltaproteobacteria bacterium]
MISVVIPVYNEVNTIKEIIKRVQSVDLLKEIIVVDDCSTDGTREILDQLKEQEGITVLFHQKNQGKGTALKTAFAQVKGEIVIIQDADLEYDPQEYSKLIRPILEGKADAVYGSRFLGGPHRVLFFWHYLGNKFFTLLSNMLTNLNLTDMETCYKVFRASLLEKITIESKRFGVEPEITAKLAKLKCRIYEVDISYSGRDYGEGKKINWKDGVAAIYWILKYNLWSRYKG